MLVILKEPLKILDYEVLAVNLNIFDEIIISNLDNQFQIMIIKHFDVHFSSHSTLYRRLDTFDTLPECLDLFHKLMDALKTGEHVFDLSVSDQSADESAKKRRSAVH